MKKKYFFLISIASVLILSFQNCSRVSTDVSPIEDTPNDVTSVPSPADETPPEPPLPPEQQPVPLSDEVRLSAATETANTNPACSINALPEGFYWEIGDEKGVRGSGSVVGNDTPSASSVIAIASSSKWVYSTYVLQKVGIRDSDLPFLRFTSGFLYSAKSGGNETGCGSQTVGECASEVVNNPKFIDQFYYSASHFQYHAANVMGLGDMNASKLTKEITTQVGKNDFTYLQTNLGGGLNASASGYAAFLRKILNKELVIGSHLGENKVCASAVCAGGLVLSPAPQDEAWNYSRGHWVEDDPLVGDGAFSSAGALGFYPWIDASQTWYGVLARRAASTGGNQGYKSILCGRLIRQAWITGNKVTETMPSK